MQGKIRIGVRLLLGLLFLVGGVAKLAGARAMVDEFGLFAQFGVGQWFRYVTGIIEVLAALMLVRPKMAFYGAALLACVCAGAFAAQIIVIRQDWIHTIVIGALAVWTALGYRNVATGGRVAKKGGS